MLVRSRVEVKVIDKVRMTRSWGATPHLIKVVEPEWSKEGI
jgi:hypothetical protein